MKEAVACVVRVVVVTVWAPDVIYESDGRRRVVSVLVVAVSWMSSVTVSLRVNDCEEKFEYEHMFRCSAACSQVVVIVTPVIVADDRCSCCSLRHLL